MNDTIRNADLADLAAMLTDQHARKLDMIVPASQITAHNGNLIVTGAEPVVDDDGVTLADGTYRPTVVCDEGISDRLEIPVAYLKRLRASRIDLYDENVNGLLHGGFVDVDDEPTMFPADPRSFLLRTFTSGDGPGVARALLSNSFRIVDNFDVLTAALEGIREAGVPVEIEGCDLTDRRMYVRVVAPSVAALAPVLLKNYRSPFDGDSGVARAGNNLDAGGHAAARGSGRFGQADGKPVVFAGFVISNSEVGGGAFSITPRLVVQVCTNGLTISKDALRAVHLGAKMDDGVIRWSDDTQRKNLELVAAQARDAVATFLDVDYVTKAIARIEEQADTAIAKPAETIETVGKRLRFSEDRTASVLEHFIRGGQMTAGGVVQAITSVAQTIDDADDAHSFEAQALPALELAASLN